MQSKDEEEIEEEKLAVMNTERNCSLKEMGLGIRHLQSLLMASCIFCGYLLRVNISVALVAMTASNETTGNEDNVPVFREWRNKDKSAILSAFFIGYLVMNFPAGIIGSYIDKKRLLAVTFAIGSILALITPFAVINTRRWEVLVAIRSVQGLMQAFMFPTVHGISAKWSPPNERSRLVGFILSGIPLGTMVILASSGIMASSSSGWPLIFYLSGCLGLVWVVVWMLFGSSCPSTNSLISKSEVLYIEQSLANSYSKKEHLKTPWMDILTSLPVWATIVAHTGHNWGFWLLLSEMPQYINSVLGFNIKSDGLLSAIPYMLMWIVQFPVMYFADNLNNRGVTTITASRKIWNSIGMWGGAISLLALGYVDESAEPAIALYIITVTIGCCCNVGFNLSHMDLSPNYAGILMGITNCIAATGGLGAPYIVAYIVTEDTSVLQWRMVFIIGAVILAISNLFFVISGSGKVQPWNSKYTESIQMKEIGAKKVNNTQKNGQHCCVDTENKQDKFENGRNRHPQ